MGEPHQIGVIAGRIDHHEVVTVLDLVDRRREAGEFGRFVLVDADTVGARDAVVVRDFEPDAAVLSELGLDSLERMLTLACRLDAPGWLDDARGAWQSAYDGRRRRALVPIWRRPWMSLAADTYGSSLLAHVGIANVFGDSADRYPEVSLGEVAARTPDVALLPSEPYAFADRHARELSAAFSSLR